MTTRMTNGHWNPTIMLGLQSETTDDQLFDPWQPNEGNAAVALVAPINIDTPQLVDSFRTGTVNVPLNDLLPSFMTLGADGAGSSGAERPGEAPSPLQAYPVQIPSGLSANWSGALNLNYGAFSLPVGLDQTQNSASAANSTANLNAPFNDGAVPLALSVVQNPTAYPWDCVCYITVHFASAGDFRGSGVIIGPHTILTASHVLWDADFQQIATVTGVSPGYSNGGTAISSQYILHLNEVDDRGDLISKTQSQFDYAIIDFAQDLSSYGSFGVLTNYGGGTVHATGYPASAGLVQTDSVGSVTVDPAFSVLDYGTLSGQISGGNSGGPIWIDQGTPANPAPYVVGVVSTGSWGVQLTSSDWQTIAAWESSDSNLWTLGSISINDVSVTEGSSGTKLEVFTVTRTGGMGAFDVHFATSDGGATLADNDYVANSGTLHFAANVNTQTISVTINGDTKAEPDEAFFVSLSGASTGITITDSQGIGTIINDDSSGSVAINDVTITEGNSGAKVATFTVTRSGGTAAFAVNYFTSDGGATTADNDYVANSGTLNFGAGVNTQTISVTINGDTKLESDEAFFVNLSGATNGATIGDNLGIGTITNDDAAPAGSVSINDVSVTEGNSGIKIETFTVTRSGGTAAFAVNYFTSDGGATIADNDYVANSGTLNFGTGVNTQTISVTINGDTKFESDEAFFVNLSGATNGATISDNLGIGTIINDDAAPGGSVSINDVTITEGNSGTKVETFTVTRSGGTAAFDVNFTTSDNSATVADGDYVTNTGTLHFGAGVNTQTILVTINGDTKFESDEAFSVTLSGATNGATISDGQGIGTITNDDALFAPSKFQLSNFAPAAGGWINETIYPRELADVNGDHMADIVGFGQDGVYVALATGGGSFGASSFKLANFAPGAGGWINDTVYPRELADVDGDGIADIVGFGQSGVYVALGTGGGSFGPSSFKLANFAPSAGGWINNTAYPRELADVNGDHMADIVGFGDGGVYVALATGGGSFGPSSFKLANFTPGAGGWINNDQFPRFLADVNGDHMADIVGFGDGGVYVALATGGGSFGPSSLQLANFGPSAGGWSSDDIYPRQLADINHDGAADIVGFGQSGVYEALSNGFHLI